MNLSSTAMSLLKNAGFDIQESSDLFNGFYFEDETIMGIVICFSSAKELLDSWRDRQNEFLKRNARLIRRSGDKAWNIYTIFLTHEKCPRDKEAEFLAVEENFEGTRKIARSGLMTSNDVKYALLPVLPLQSLAPIKEINIQEELKSRLDLTEVTQAALLGSASPKELADKLLDES